MNLQWIPAFLSWTVMITGSLTSGLQYIMAWNRSHFKNLGLLPVKRAAEGTGEALELATQRFWKEGLLHLFLLTLHVSLGTITVVGCIAWNFISFSKTKKPKKPHSRHGTHRTPPVPEPPQPPQLPGITALSPSPRCHARLSVPSAHGPPRGRGAGPGLRPGAVPGLSPPPLHPCLAPGGAARNARPGARSVAGSPSQIGRVKHAWLHL